MSLQEYCAFVHWGLVLMTCIDDLDVGMTLQEYCAMVHAVLTVFAMMALVFSVRAFAEGSVFIGMYGKVDYFFFLRCTDVLWYFLWRFESVVLLCVGLYCNSLREAIFDTPILWWPRLFGQTHCYFTKVFRCYYVVVTYVQLCLFCIILLYLCMRGWCHFGLYWFSFVLLPCLYDFQVVK